MYNTHLTDYFIIYILKIYVNSVGLMLFTGINLMLFTNVNLMLFQRRNAIKKVLKT